MFYHFLSEQYTIIVSCSCYVPLPIHFLCLITTNTIGEEEISEASYYEILYISTIRHLSRSK